MALFARVRGSTLLGVAAGAIALMAVAAPALADDTGFASIHTQANVGGRLCMTDHSHHGSGETVATRKAAEVSAIRSWADFTALEYGSDWSNYGVAIRKQMSCTQASTGWQCSLDASPCRAGKSGYVAKRTTTGKAVRTQAKPATSRTAAQ